MWSILSSILFSQWTALVAVAVFLFYKWSIANYKFFEEKGIAFEKPVPLVGHLWPNIRQKENFSATIERHYLKFGHKKFFGFFQLRKPMLCINDTELIKKITIKDFDHFVDHQQMLDASVDPLFGRALTVLRGEEWRHMRSTLSPAFTGSKMRQMFQLVVGSAQNAVGVLLPEAENGALVSDMKDLCARITTDVIATAVFGMTTNSLKDRENIFYTMAQKATNNRSILAGLRFFFVIGFPKLAKWLNITMMPSEQYKFYRSIVKETMEYREKHGVVCMDMITNLMDAGKGRLKSAINEEESVEFAVVEELQAPKISPTKNYTWTHDDITAQCMTFFIAGFESTSNLICFASHELTENPEVQKKLLLEIDNVNVELQGKPLTYDALQKMKYLDMVVAECLRKWPPAFATDRLCIKPYTIEDEDGRKIRIEKNDVIMIPLYGLHHDPKYFPDPKKFDPERFSDENKGTIPRFTYMPFGSGPRNCIASRFALMETKVVLFYLLSAFSFEISPKTQVPLVLEKSFMLKTEKGIFIELKPRK